MNQLTLLVLIFSTFMAIAGIKVTIVDKIVGKIQAKRVLKNGEEILRRMEKEASLY